MRKGEPVFRLCFRLLAAFPLLFLLTGGAQVEDRQRPDGFARKFVEAVNSKDPERRTEIVHPLSRACMTTQTQPYYDWIFTRQARYVIPSTYTARATPLPQGAPPTPDGHAVYPVRPTHQLQIDFTSGPQSSASVIVLVVFDGARWREVLPCPHGDVIGRAKASQAEEEQRDQKAGVLVAQMPPPLRGELLDLLKAGRRVDAIRRYTDASGEDLTTARSVIDLLSPRGGLR
jgi:hypothetical protein